MGIQVCRDYMNICPYSLSRTSQIGFWGLALEGTHINPCMTSLTKNPKSTCVASLAAEPGTTVFLAMPQREDLISLYSIGK